MVSALSSAGPQMTESKLNRLFPDGARLYRDLRSCLTGNVDVGGTAIADIIERVSSGAYGQTNNQAHYARHGQGSNNLSSSIEHLAKEFQQVIERDEKELIESQRTSSGSSDPPADLHDAHHSSYNHISHTADTLQLSPKIRRRGHNQHFMRGGNNFNLDGSSSSSSYKWDFIRVFAQLVQHSQVPNQTKKDQISTIVQALELFLFPLIREMQELVVAESVDELGGSSGPRRRIVGARASKRRRNLKEKGITVLTNLTQLSNVSVLTSHDSFSTTNICPKDESHLKLEHLLSIRYRLFWTRLTDSMCALGDLVQMEQQDFDEVMGGSAEMAGEDGEGSIGGLYKKIKSDLELWIKSLQTLLESASEALLFLPSYLLRLGAYEDLIEGMVRLRQCVKEVQYRKQIELHFALTEALDTLDTNEKEHLIQKGKSKSGASSGASSTPSSPSGPRFPNGKYGGWANALQLYKDVPKEQLPDLCQLNCDPRISAFFHSSNTHVPGPGKPDMLPASTTTKSSRARGSGGFSFITL